METTDGASGTPDLLQRLSDLYIRSKQIDLESTREDRNIPDRVDQAHGITATGTAATAPGLAGVPVWAWGLIALAAVGAGVAIFRH